MDAHERDASTQKARTLSTKSFKNSSPGPRNALQYVPNVRSSAQRFGMHDLHQAMIVSVYQ
jgi:hypothetical protein